MKLPVNAIIATDKLTLCLLVPQPCGDASAFLDGTGYSLQEVD